MKLFYHLFTYLFLGMIVLIAIDEYLSFKVEISQYETDMISNAVQDGKSLSGLIAHAYRNSGEQKALELISEANEFGTLNIRWVWPGQLVEATTDQGRKGQFQKVLAGETISFKTESNNSTRLRYTYVPVDVGLAHPGALELTQTLKALKEFRSLMVYRALVISVLLALVYGSILYFFINRNIRAPLRILVQQAEEIGRGNLTINNDIRASDELALMGQTMNDMCSRLLIANEKIKFEYDARVKTLDQLRYTERLSSFGVIAAGIAHELGTPLNVVDGRAKMIIREDLSPEEMKDCATIIKNQSDRMTVIIRQLLDFTRRPKQHVASENLTFLIKQIFQLLYPMASKQKVTFLLNKEESTKEVFNADFSQLQQVLVNLFVNAIQAMPEGGKVYVTLSNVLKSPLPASHQDRQEYMKIRIKDEGEGIRKENMEHIFTPFFTTKTLGTGTGLGLSIAHGIVEEHGGWIDIKNADDAGACFTIYLPMKEC